MTNGADQPGTGDSPEQKEFRSNVRTFLAANAKPKQEARPWAVNFHVDPVAEAAGFDKMTSILKVTLKDGRVLSGRADFAKGSPANPMSFDEVADKFRGCAEFAKWPKEKTEAAIKFVKTLESAPDMSKLSALLTA